MAYLTATELVDRLGTPVALKLTTDTGSTVDTALITAIITEVEGRVNSFVAQRTTDEITPASHPNTFVALRGAVVAIAGYQLHLRRHPVPEDWKEANDEAMMWLKALAAGEVPLPDAALNVGAEWGSEDQNAALIHEDW